ncbi:hypothetical protein LTR94_027474, partial [Friedmanniomyces endolithicus]
MALEAMAKRLQSRVAFGKRIADHSIWEQRVARARIDIEMTRLLCLKAADMMDRAGNKAARNEIAMIKVQAPQMALKIIDDAVQAHGGGGVSDDFLLAADWASIRTLRLADGPDEVHARAIARAEFRKHRDAAHLARWMRGAVPGFSDLRAMQKFSDGQSNPTYRIDTAGGPFVLRRKPFGTLLPSAHAVDREFRLLSALHPTGFPVPGPVALCEDEAVIGSVFYLMEMVDGRTFWDGTLPDVAKGDRRPLYAAMIDTMAALHAIDHETVGLADFGAPGNYVQRQVERWTKQYRAAQTDDIPEMDRLIDWLPRTLPEQSRTAIIHGDYRIDNLIFAADAPRVAA